MDDQWTRNPFGEERAGRLRDQPLLPLPPAWNVEWPATLSIAIQTTLPAALDDREGPDRRYVRAVRARYLWLPDTPSVTSRHDHRFAKWLYGLGVDLFVVEAALLVAAARRALREPERPPLPSVRALAYFGPVIAEILASSRPPDLDYLVCLLRRLRPLAELKLAGLRHQADYGDAHQNRLTHDLRNSRKSFRRTWENPR